PFTFLGRRVGGEGKTFPLVPWREGRRKGYVMGRMVSGGKKIGIAGLVLLIILAGAGAAWMQRARLLAWYYFYRLSQAGGPRRTAWAERVAGLETDALTRLLTCLTRDDARACANAQAALTCLVERWKAREEQRAALADRLAGGFAQMSLPGQQSALELGA